MSITHETYTFIRRGRKWKKKFGCLTDAINYIQVWADWMDIQIYDSKDRLLYPFTPGEVIP